MKDTTARTENDIVLGVDWRDVWPGHALAYRIEELKIKELKARAKREPGEELDQRRFHNALLDDGALPLELLEKRTDDWIAEQKRKT